MSAMLRRLLVAVLIVSTCSWACAADEGQDDLDAAIEKKLDVKKFEELAEVIRLGESALKKGLGEANTTLAKELLAGTYGQRGMELAEITIRAMTLSPDKPDWLQARAAALADLEKAIEYDPKAADAHLMIARMQGLPGGKRDRARTAIDQAIELSDADAHQLSRALVLRAELSDDPDQQQPDLDRAVKVASKDDEIVRSRGIFFLLKRKDSQAALADFDTAAKLDPQDTGTQHLRGLTLMEMDKPHEAVAAFEKALELGSKNPQTRLQLALAMVQDKNGKGALGEMDKLLEESPDNPAILMIRARIRQQLGELDEAKKDVEAALAQRPNLPVALEFRAMLAANDGDFKQAIHDCSELLKLSPKNVQLLIQLGLFHTAAKQPRKAVDYFTQALAVEPENVAARRMRGDAFLTYGAHPEAVEDFTVAFKQTPKDSTLLNNYAWLLATSPDEKVRDGKRAIELATAACEATEFKAPHILSTLAAAYAEVGDWDNAKKWIAKALELGPGEDHLDQLKKERESYAKQTPWRETQAEPDAAEPQNRTAATEKPSESSESK